MSCDLIIDIQKIVETKFGVKIRFVVNISVVCVGLCHKLSIFNEFWVSHLKCSMTKTTVIPVKCVYFGIHVLQHNVASKKKTPHLYLFVSKTSVFAYVFMPKRKGCHFIGFHFIISLQYMHFGCDSIV